MSNLLHAIALKALFSYWAWFGRISHRAELVNLLGCYGVTKEDIDRIGKV